jgi:hypothetical protein
MLTVRREDFIPSRYRDHAYEEIPLPLPGERATISCPHSYPLFYEPLALGAGHRFLEVGAGSAYGTSLAREVVGREGLVVAIDIDATTLAFARENLERAGYTDVVLVHGDGGSRGTRARPLRPDLRHGGLPRHPAAAARAAHAAGPADRTDHGRHAPATHPPGEDSGRRPAQGSRGRVVRVPGGTVRRAQRSAPLSRLRRLLCRAGARAGVRRGRGRAHRPSRARRVAGVAPLLMPTNPGTTASLSLLHIPGLPEGADPVPAGAPAACGTARVCSDVGAARALRLDGASFCVCVRWWSNAPVSMGSSARGELVRFAPGRMSRRAVGPLFKEPFPVITTNPYLTSRRWRWTMNGVG